MTKLINTNGLIGVIMPTGILTDKSNINLRNYILDAFSYLNIKHFPEKAKVFKNVTQDVSIYILSNNKKEIMLSKGLMNSDDLKSKDSILIPKDIVIYLEKIPLINSSGEISLLSKLCKLDNFKKDNFVSFIEGEIHLTKFSDAIRSSKESENIFNLIRGDAVQRYLFLESKKDSFIDDKIVKSISSSKKLNDRNNVRLVYQQVVNTQKDRRLNFQLLENNSYVANTCGYVVNNSNYDIKYFLGLLNSKLLNWRYKLTSSNNHILTNELYNLPIPLLDMSNTQDREMHDKIVTLVDNIITLNKKLSAEKNPNSITIINRQINAIDRQIDSLVYKIYNLDESDIKIIEE